MAYIDQNAIAILLHIERKHLLLEKYLLLDIFLYCFCLLALYSFFMICV